MRALQLTRIGSLAFCALGTILAQVPKAGIPGPCTNEGVAEIPGVWVRRPDNLSELSRSTLAPAQKAKLLAKADAAAAILQKAYPNPRGLVAWQYRWAPRSRTPKLPVHVGVNSLYLQYRCFQSYRTTGQPLTTQETESDAWVVIELNSLGAALSGELADGYEMPNGNPVYANSIRLEGEFRGVPVIRGKVEKNATVVYLGRENRLPLRPVTREEILRIHAGYWQKKMQEEIASAQRAVARHPADLARHKRMTGESDKDWERRNASFVRGQEAEVKRVEEFKALALEIPKRIEAQIGAMTPGERRAPAALGPINTFSYEDLKFSPAAGGEPLVTVDEGYFNKALPLSAVQYMTVFWRRVPGSPPKEAALDEILKNLDFEALRALLDP